MRIDEVLVAGLCDLCLAAGDVILRIRRGGLAVSRKADASPVTEADRQAEALILAGLADLAPEVPVVAEEAAAAGRMPAEAPERFFLVDPLDGTREFVAGGHDFTVNIGLIEARRPVLGAVLAPITGELFWTGADGQAWRRQGEGPAQRLGCRAAPGGRLTALASRVHRDPATEAFLATQPVADIRSFGSSLKFCRLAEGVADLYPRFGRTMEWDTAAGHAVLVAAGGSVLTPEGTPFLYGKPGFENGPFIARGRPAAPS